MNTTKTLDELMADFEPERLAQIERDEATARSPAALARKAAKEKAEREKHIRQGLMTEDGEWIEQPETDEENDDENGDDEND